MIIPQCPHCLTKHVGQEKGISPINCEYWTYPLFLTIWNPWQEAWRRFEFKYKDNDNLKKLRNPGPEHMKKAWRNKIEPRFKPHDSMTFPELKITLVDGSTDLYDSIEWAQIII